jgi:hypothetical protein
VAQHNDRDFSALFAGHDTLAAASVETDAGLRVSHLDGPAADTAMASFTWICLLDAGFGASAH